MSKKSDDDFVDAFILKVKSDIEEKVIERCARECEKVIGIDSDGDTRYRSGNYLADILRKELKREYK